MNLQSIVNLKQYPIDNADSGQYTAFLEETKSKYINDGVVILQNFLTNEAVTKSVNDVLSEKGEEWMTDSSHNVFLDNGDTSFPDNHIR